MNEPTKAAETATVPVENRTAGKTADTPRPPQVITDPREIAAVVMAQVSIVNAKKEEMTIAVKRLSDMTQQLVIAYAGQARFIERLAKRAQVQEEKPNGHQASQRAA